MGASPSVGPVNGPLQHRSKKAECVYPLHTEQAAIAWCHADFPSWCLTPACTQGHTTEILSAASPKGFLLARTSNAAQWTVQHVFMHGSHVCSLGHQAKSWLGPCQFILGDLEGLTLVLLCHTQPAHLAEAAARFRKEQHTGKEGFLKYFLAVTNKKKG